MRKNINEKYVYNVIVLDHKFSLLLLGNRLVGKTSIMRTAINIPAHFFTSLIVDIAICEFKFCDIDFPLLIWDLSGNSLLRDIQKIVFSYFSIDGALIVYDRSDPSSVQSLPYWFEFLFEITNNKNLLLGIVGNKSDLLSSQAYSKQEYEIITKLKEKYEHLPLLFNCSVSAENKWGISGLFNFMMQEFLFHNLDLFV